MNQATKISSLLKTKSDYFFVIPFYTDALDITVNIPHYEIIEFSSKKMLSRVENLVYSPKRENELEAILSIREHKVKNVICKYKYNNNLYEFMYEKTRIYSFKDGINFMVVDIDPLKVNGVEIDLDELDNFLDYINRLKENNNIEFNNSSRDVTSIINKLLSDFEYSFSLAESTKKLSEKAKMYCYLLTDEESIYTKIKDEYLHLLSTNRSTESIIISRKNINEYDQTLALGSSEAGTFVCGLFTNEDSEAKYYENFKKEGLLSYILILYNYYYENVLLEKFSNINATSFENENLEKTIRSIRTIQKNYYLENFNLNYPEYSKIPVINTMTLAWKEYFAKKNLSSKIENELTNLLGILEVNENEIKEKKRKEKEEKVRKIELIVIILTSIFTLFTITEGTNKLIDRFMSANGDKIKTIVLIVSLALWITIVIFSIWKFKKTKN